MGWFLMCSFLFEVGLISVMMWVSVDLFELDLLMMVSVLLCFIVKLMLFIVCMVLVLCVSELGMR